MGYNQQWGIDIEKEIQGYRETFKKRKQRQLKLKHLSKFVEVVNKQSESCEQCEKIKDDIDHLVKSLKTAPGFTKLERKKYSQAVLRIKNHLQTKHNLIVKNDLVGAYMVMGIAIGMSLGMLIFNTFIYGQIYGLLIGIIIGEVLEKKAEKEGRLI